MTRTLAALSLLAACQSSAPDQPPSPRVVVERPEPATATAAPVAQDAQDVPLATDAELAALARAGQWEELIGAASDRLARTPDDQAALYGSGRAHLERGQQLLSGGRFARELAGTLLRRAAELLASVRPEGERSDAPEWAFFARYLAADDEALAADLERAAAQGSGYAARLRGQLARDRDEDSALAWFLRAAELMPVRADVRIDVAMARAGRGDRAGALAALDEARALGAERGAWLATLLAVLPTADDAGELLARLAPLLAAPGAERDATLAWYRAWGLQELGRFQEAEAVLAAATENRRPEVDRTHAALLLRLQRPLEAAALVQPLAAAGDAEALEQLVTSADTLAQSFRWAESLDLYDEALAIEPAHVRARANRALTQSRSGGPLDGYDALVAAHPQRADILNDAALSRLARGDREAARALFLRAVALPPEGAGVPDARENLAALMLSDRPPDVAGALTLLAAVLETDPGRDRSLVLRAQARAALNASAGHR